MDEQEQMIPPTPEEKLAEVRDGLAGDVDKGKKAIASAITKAETAIKRLNLFDSGCRGLGLRAEIFSVTDSMETQFEEPKDDEDAPEEA